MSFDDDVNTRVGRIFGVILFCFVVIVLLLILL